MKNNKIFSLYQKLQKFGASTTPYSITVNAAKTKNIRVLQPYVDEYVQLHNEIIDKHSKTLKGVKNKDAELYKLCEKEFAELDNMDFPEVDQMLSTIEVSALPQDIPPNEYSLLEDIIIL